VVNDNNMLTWLPEMPSGMSFYFNANKAAEAANVLSLSHLKFKMSHHGFVSVLETCVSGLGSEDLVHIPV